MAEEAAKMESKQIKPDETPKGENQAKSDNVDPDLKDEGKDPIKSLDFIFDIPLRFVVELGRTKMTVREILQLSQGSVVELTKFSGEPLEILVNDKLIARGEVVVINEKFGIRLTDIISPIERIEQLK